MKKLLIIACFLMIMVQDCKAMYGIKKMLPALKISKKFYSEKNNQENFKFWQGWVAGFGCGSSLTILVLRDKK